MGTRSMQDTSAVCATDHPLIEARPPSKLGVRSDRTSHAGSTDSLRYTRHSLEPSIMSRCFNFGRLGWMHAVAIPVMTSPLGSNSLAAAQSVLIPIESRLSIGPCGLQQGLDAIYIDMPAATNEQAESILASNPADVTFIATTLDYPNGPGDNVFLGNVIADLLGIDSFGGPNADDSVEGFVFRFSGAIQIDSSFDTTPGGAIDVAFALGSDDGSVLQIGGVEVIDNGGDHGFSFQLGAAVFEEPGYYPVEILYYNNAFGGGLEWYSSIPGGVDSGAPAGVDGIVPTGVLVRLGSEECCADIDGDGNVGAADLARVLGAWGSADVDADLDASGTVDPTDLALLLGAWGPCA